MVLVPVTVTDHNGKTIDGLQAENFAVFDERVPRRIVSFVGDDLPCSVGLLLDVSGSMRGTLNVSKDVVHAFLAESNPQDEFSLLGVSTRPEAISNFTTDLAVLEQSVQFSQAGGRTALIDTVYLGLNRMRDASRPRRALFILSDGMDNNSRYSKAELMRVAVEADTQIYTIIIDNASANKKPIELAEERRGEALLEDLSERTGGLTFRVRNTGEALKAARKVGKALRSEYVIGYQAPDPTAQGKWRRIRVKVDVPHTSVSARNGYYSR
jgi:Ca-activated chloride channel family protein